MKKFKVVYGVGGGYNDIQKEVLEFSSLEEAEEYAYESAVDIFNSYGIDEEVEGWCSYYAEELPES